MRRSKVLVVCLVAAAAMAVHRGDDDEATTSGFERRATSAWRSIRRHLPASVAEAIRKPAKRALRALGLVGHG